MLLVIVQFLDLLMYKVKPVKQLYVLVAKSVNNVPAVPLYAPM